MNIREVKDAVINQQKLVWNDPDPIEGNDYTIRSISYIDDEMAVIQYGDNTIMFDNKPCLSEAEVFISEISVVKFPKFWI